MSEKRIVSRYAKSLLELAVERNALEEINTDMLQLSGLADNSRDLELMLQSPVIPHQKKLTILKEIFTGKVNEMTLKFFLLLTQKQREPYLLEIAKEFHHQYNVYKNIEEATVTTTFPLSDDLKKEFEKVVTGISNKKAELKEIVDESIIGGFILRINDRQIDDSIHSRLKALRTAFAKNQYDKAI